MPSGEVGRLGGNGMNRREFLRDTSAALGAAAATLLASQAVSALNKITFALIGCGGMGRANLRDFLRLPDFECVALCDVDKNQVASAGRHQEGRPTR
jgi:ornithine cyclodeaminase/alanine dehydrogenase-like protein (mu-crystallin family)